MSNITLKDLAELYVGTNCVFELVLHDGMLQLVARLYPNDLIEHKDPHFALDRVFNYTSESYDDFLERLVQHAAVISHDVVQVFLLSYCSSKYPQVLKLLQLLNNTEPNGDTINIQFQFDDIQLPTYLIQTIINSKDELLTRILKCHAERINIINPDLYQISIEESLERFYSIPEIDYSKLEEEKY